MNLPKQESPFQILDERRDCIIFKEKRQAIDFASQHLADHIQGVISEQDSCSIALSGGSTPKPIYEQLCTKYKDRIDWSKIHLFWSDERSVSPDSPDSNFHMAMSAGLESMPIPTTQIHRMKAEDEIQQHAQDYEQLIPKNGIDLTLLGMGDDGHTASLFPNTHGLHSSPERKVIANFVPKLDTWRMTFTFSTINLSKHIVFFSFGDKKAAVLKEVLQGQEQFDLLPSQKIGTADNKALWILDAAAASELRLQ